MIDLTRLQSEFRKIANGHIAATEKLNAEWVAKCEALSAEFGEAPSCQAEAFFAILESEVSRMEKKISEFAEGS